MILASKHLYLFAFLEGATVMAVELLAAKMLAPYFGSGLYTWGAVIGVTLISLSLGYYLGGIISSRVNLKFALHILYWVILFSSVFIILMPSVSKSLPFSFENINHIISVILISIILLLPALLFLGMVPTLLIQLLSEKVENSGRVTGSVYTISTLGGIFGVFLMGFYVIPEFGLSTPAIITGLMLGIITFMLLLMHGKIAVLVYFAVVAFAFLSLKEKKTHSNLPAGQAGIKVLYNSEGLLGQLLVADMPRYGRNSDFKRTDRYLFLNRIGQTGVNLSTGKSISSYVNYLSSLASILPENSNVLLLGLGGGSVVNELQQNLKLNFDAVELDERIAQIAQRFFSLSSNTDIIIDDARHYIERTEKSYDLIIFDVFKGEIPPAHLFSLECFEKARSKLNPEGFIIVNFNGFIEGELGKAGRSLYKTLKAAGLEVHILPTHEVEEKYRNNLFVAMSKTKNFNKTRMPLIVNGLPVDIATLFIDIDKIDMGDVMVLSDNKPLLEHYNMNAAQIWRAEYNRNFTKMFTEKGVPLFD